MLSALHFYSPAIDIQAVNLIRGGLYTALVRMVDDVRSDVSEMEMPEAVSAIFGFQRPCHRPGEGIGPAEAHDVFYYRTVIISISQTFQ